ncbi:hypothetical protein ABZ565_32555 [Streptomyces sp. NPDC016469]|uniref:hypothetical protein n=1 Tax=Streptomyces sp. NPDC016469 TaxID=3157191 RepID=UPI0033F599F0
MSAVVVAQNAARTVVEPRHGWKRTRFGQVPAQAGPAKAPMTGHPLALGRRTRAKLRAAVHALLDVPGLHGALDAVRLAVLVLASRTPSENGVVEIRTRELGRWLGLSASYTASVVVPTLRRSGVVAVETADGEFGQDNGLKCQVWPLSATQGVTGHPLNLSKKDFATLWALVDAVMAPGWTHRDGRVTPPGLIGTRTGRGAATDRLALLLLVLEARESGRVRLCGGTVDTKRGRAAATVARLLGSSASAGERVLERLEGLELVVRVRLRTRSGMPHRSRLMVPAVAAAHGRSVLDDVQEDRAGAGDAEFSGPDVTAGGSQPSETDMEPQVSDAPVTDVAEVTVPDGAADLHSDHPHSVAPVVPVQLSGRFSGEGRRAEGRRPERVRAREDQAADGESIVTGTTSSAAQDGPLRGENPIQARVGEREGKRSAPAAGDRAPAGGWKKAQRPRRVAPSGDLDLRVALAPVSGLWEQLSGWQQDQVQAATTTALAQMTGLGVVPQDAPRLLAARLTDRLTETGGEALVTDPYAWLIRRGLVQRRACTHLRCDDGIRLDTGQDCENCGNLIHVRRARRARIGADIDRELPGLPDDERQRVLDERLREHAVAEAESLARRQEEAREQQARRAAARAEAAVEAERERKARAAAEAERQAVPCADCGLPRAAGLCEACRYGRRTEDLVAQCGLLAATWAAALEDPADVAAVTDHVRATVQADIARARHELARAAGPGELATDPAAAASALAYAGLQAAETALEEYRSSALGALGRSEEAEAEYRSAYRTERHRHIPHPLDQDAVKAAVEAGDTARKRVAENLLAVRLEQLRDRADVQDEQVPVASWPERLAGLAARPLPEDTAETVAA